MDCINWLEKAIVCMMPVRRNINHTPDYMTIDDIIKRCDRIIGNVFDNLISNDVMGVCHSHRDAIVALRHLRRASICSNMDRTYYVCLLESVEMVAEVSRHIMSVSESGMTTEQLKVIRTIKTSRINCVDADMLGNDEDYMMRIIASHINGMEKYDWDDSCLSYLYLQLLYNINTASKCRARLLSHMPSTSWSSR